LITAKMSSHWQKLLLLSFCLTCHCTRLDWGSDPDLVLEDELIQGREKVRLMLLLVGENRSLTCELAFAKDPVDYTDLIWRIDGRVVDDGKFGGLKEEFNGEMFLEEHLRIGVVTKEMAGSSITCEYSKGQFGTRVEAILQVFDPEIEVKSPRSLKLTFRDIASTGQEVVGSDTNLGRRLHQKIKEMLGNKTTIHSDDTAYFVEVTKAHGCKKLRYLNPIVRNRFKKVKNSQPFHDDSKDACRLTDLCSNECTNVANARRQPFTP